MKRFITGSFIALTLLIGGVGAYAPLAHADPQTHAPVGGTGAPLTGGGTSPSGASTPTTLPQNPIDNSTLDTVIIWIMGLFAWLLGVAAITLDNTVYYTVVTMGDYVNHLSAIGVAWRILRDIGNVVLIFGFLAIGITTILDVKWYGGGAKMLPMLLVAAIFLNFSLFISEAIIDAGNLFATEFYTQINGGKLTTPPSYSDIQTEGISNKILSQLGLANIYGDALSSNPNHNYFKPGTSWIIGFMGILIFLIAAFVMFSLAFILIARFVALVFLIVIAPLGFAGLAVPQLAGTANKWWKHLFEQTITAPVLLLLLYIALAVITDASFLTGFNPGGQTAGGWTGFSDGNFAGFAGVILSFLVAMGLLMAVVIVSKSLSAFGAERATKLASWPGRAIGGTLASQGVGRLGRRLQRFNTSVRSTRTGRNVGRVLSVLSAGALSDYEVQKATGKMQEAKFGRSSSVADKDKFNKARKGELGIDLNAAVNSGNDADVRRILGSMSVAELARSRHVQSGTPIVMRNIPQARFDDVLRHENMSPSARATAAAARTTSVRGQYTDGTDYRDANGNVAPSLRPPAPGGAAGNMTQGERAVRNLSDETAAQLPDTILQLPEVYENLSLSQLNAIQRRGSISPAARNTIGAFLASPRTNPDFAAYVAGLLGPGGAPTGASIAIRRFWNLP